MALELAAFSALFEKHCDFTAALIAGYTERLIAVEERVSDLERK